VHRTGDGGRTKEEGLGARPPACMAFTVNGELVEDSVVRAEIRSIRPRYESMAHGMDPAAAEKQLREWCRENVIERVLLRQEALVDPEPIPVEAIEETLRSISPPPEDSGEVRKDIEIGLRVERLIERVTSKVSPPRRKEVTDYYRKHKEQFLTPEGLTDFEQVREAIEAGLHQRKKERVLESFLDRLKVKAIVEEVSEA
jgi:hypothetical protein